MVENDGKLIMSWGGWLLFVGYPAAILHRLTQIRP
jgi:hypothetical protein